LASPSVKSPTTTHTLASPTTSLPRRNSVPRQFHTDNPKKKEAPLVNVINDYINPNESRSLQASHTDSPSKRVVTESEETIELPTKREILKIINELKEITNEEQKLKKF